jgi:putative ABC transport system permease protein
MANSVRLDLPVLLGALGLAVVAGVVIAVGLGTQSGRAGLQEALRAADRAVSRVTKRGRFALIAAEVGLSLVLLVGAALLIVTLRNLWKVSPGFEAKGRWTLQISLPVAEHSGTEEIWRLESAISRRLEDIPGVTNVATTSSLPLERGLNDWVTAERGGERVQVSVERRLVGLPYFAAMGIPIVRGRSFLPGDSRSAPAVVIVNAALSKATWPQQNPVGKVVRIDGAAARVVGVAGDVREWGLDAAPPAIVYQPQAQASDDMTRAVAGWFPTAWIIKAERPPSFDEVRRAVAAVDVAQPIVNFRPMEDTLRAWLGRWRFVATLLETFAALALLLASVAVYSVVSYAVAHRRREIGLRMAIGATRSSVLKLIFAQGMRPALVGTGVGIAASLILTRTLSSLLFGVEPADPVVLGGAALILLLVASLACLAPSWLAMRLDPADALRSV